jgi:hypothetical protein
MTPFLPSVYEFKNVIMSHMGDGGRKSIQYALLNEGERGFAVCVYASNGVLVGGKPPSNVHFLQGFEYHESYEDCLREYSFRVSLPEVPL